MLLQTNNANRAARKTQTQCALDRDAAAQQAEMAADAETFESNGLEFDQPNEPIFRATKAPKTIKFNVDLLDAWSRA